MALPEWAADSVLVGLLRDLMKHFNAIVPKEWKNKWPSSFEDLAATIYFERKDLLPRAFICRPCNYTWIPENGWQYNCEKCGKSALDFSSIIDILLKERR